MKNKPFMSSILVVFILTLVMSFTGYLEKFTFFYLINNSTIGFILCFVVLNVLTVYTIMELLKVTLRLVRNESYNYKNILISILITIGFNMGGGVYSTIFRMPLNESLLSVLFNAYVLLFINYLLFKSLLSRQHNQIRNVRD